MLKKIISITTLLFVCSFFSVNATILKSNKSMLDMSTPEKTIQSFVLALASGDINSVYATFDSKDYSENANLTKFINRLNCWAPNMDAPNTDPIFKSIKFAEKQGFLARELQGLIYSVVLPASITSQIEGQTITNDQNITNTVKNLKTSKIKNLKIKRIDIPFYDIYVTARNMNNYKLQADSIGAQKHESRIVLYELDGQLWEGGFELMQYNHKWEIDTLQCSLANFPIDGYLTRTTESDYSKLLK
jgi:hypothetical protein